MVALERTMMRLARLQGISQLVKKITCTETRIIRDVVVTEVRCT